MPEKKYVSKKLVTVRCNAPFRIGHIPFAGVCNKVTLSVEDISKCIEHKALVVEHLKTGQEVQLGFDNYNTYNGPSIIDSESPVTKFAEPVIERIENGKVTLVNQIEEKVEEDKKVVQIDLESINKKKEEEQTAAEEAKKAKEAAEAQKAKEEKQREEQKKRDEEERKRALDAVLEREKKEASDQKNAGSGVVEISIKKPEDVVADKKETVTEIPGTLEVAAPEEHIEMVVPGVAGDTADVNAPDVVKEDNNQQQNNNKKDKKNKHH